MKISTSLTGESPRPSGPATAPRRSVGAVRQRQLGGGGHALEIPACPVSLWVAPDQVPERGRMSWLDQVCDLVDQHIVDHPGGHPTQSGRKPHGSITRSAGPPPHSLVGDPANAGRWAHIVQVAPAEHTGTVQQLCVARPPPPLLSSEPLEHDANPPVLLGTAHPRRQKHHHAVTVAVCAHGAPATLAPADLDPGQLESRPSGAGARTCLALPRRRFGHYRNVPPWTDSFDPSD